MILENYLLSLPERAIRSAAALVGGSSLLLTETLLPEMVRSTTTYQVLIGDLQKILITRVAQIDVAVDGPDERFSDQYMHKKLVGSSLEAIGLLTVRFSPVWAFAIIGDAAGGGQVFLQRLVNNLKANGIIDSADQPDGLADLLAAIQKAAQVSARTVDTPPLNSDELASVTEELRATYRAMGNRSQHLLNQVNGLGSRMDQIAQDQDLSYEQVSGIMAIDASKLSASAVRAGLALSQTGGELFAEQILASYSRTLDRIASMGPGTYLSEGFTPFLEAALDHLDPVRSTWTEKVLLPTR